MKKSLFIAFLFSALVSCKSSTPPKEVAKEFIKAVHTGDAATASSLAADKTKAFINIANTGVAGASADESFSLATLTETVDGNTAEVKNDMIKLSLLKEAEGWKVNATPDVVSNIANRQTNLAALKTKWEALLKEYEGRLRLATDFVQYKRGLGALSPQMQTLEERVKTLSVKQTWDKKKILQYAQKQNGLAEMIDKSIEPSYTAGADISMNYILQISHANDRIKSAAGEYNLLAEKTPSQTYPVIALK